MLKFNELPEDIQNAVLKVLKAYDEVDVIFEDSKYQLVFGDSRYQLIFAILKKDYAADFQYIETYYAEDLYSTKQRDLNYIEVYGCEPDPSYTER